MRYYPLSQVVTGSRTDGTEFQVEGKPYSGPYYTTSNGKYFTGNDPVTGQSKIMTPMLPIVSNIDEENLAGYMPGYTILSTQTTEDYMNLKNIDVDGYRNFLPIYPFYINPTEVDYKKGYIIRYFAKKRVESGNLIEIDKNIFLSLQRTDSPYDYAVYHTIDTYWQLTGPLRDEVNPKTGVRTKGIIDNNKRLIETKEPIFKGLVAYIGENYTKYTKSS